MPAAPDHVFVLVLTPPFRVGVDVTIVLVCRPSVDVTESWWGGRWKPPHISDLESDGRRD